MLGRFFQRLQKRVERRRREHVDFVDDINLEAGRGRPVAHAVDQFPDVVDSGPRGRVHFQDIDMTILGDRLAMFADPARLGGRPALSVDPPRNSGPAR